MAGKRRRVDSNRQNPRRDRQFEGGSWACDCDEVRSLE